MKRTRFTDEQIVGVLHEATASGKKLVTTQQRRAAVTHLRATCPVSDRRAYRLVLSKQLCNRLPRLRRTGASGLFP